MLNKIWGYLATFIAGALALLAFKSRKEHFEDTSPQDDSVEAIKEDVEKIDKEIEDVKENGVEDKDKQSEIDYWKEN